MKCSWIRPRTWISRVPDRSRIQVPQRHASVPRAALGSCESSRVYALFPRGSRLSSFRQSTRLVAQVNLHVAAPRRCIARTHLLASLQLPSPRPTTSANPAQVCPWKKTTLCPAPCTLHPAPCTLQLISPRRRFVRVRSRSAPALAISPSPLDLCSGLPARAQCGLPARGSSHPTALHGSHRIASIRRSAPALSPP